MGRIKNALVKRTTKKLVADMDIFNGNFEDDKKLLGSNTMPSKRLRNMIAGYIARLKKAQVRNAVKVPT